MGSSSAEVSTIVKNWREHPSASYSLKIHSFSQLEHSTASSDHKYQSRLFSYGGYNWRLILYPKGNGEDNGSGFISMYVEIDSESLMVSKVFAELRFFVYNKKENKYFTIQDVEVKRFNALKTRWGMQQILPCDTFNNPDNGYIFEGGQCEFGVDVIVAPPLTNWEVLSFSEKYSDPKFSWTIKKFSELKEDVTSRTFSMGGKKWRLIIYPQGNGKDNGSGYISMYVEIESESLMVLTPPTEVFAEIRFFVYNKKENKYLTIQDIEVKRFNALKTVWGLQQIIPCDTFSNPENGYIFEGGQCEFGVDVIVSLPLTNWEVLSYTENFSDSKFSWAIKNFSELKENVQISKSFSMGGNKWFLKLYPKVDNRADGKCLSIFLFFFLPKSDCDKPKADEKIFVQANFRVLDPRGSNHFQRQFNYWHNEKTLGGGWVQFLSLPELRKVYLDKEDALKVEIAFEAVSATKYSPTI
ncbi:unnamed protein product [Brassica oleracea]